MNGRSNENIRNERQEIIEGAIKEYGEINVIDSFFDENNPITDLTAGFNSLGHLGMALILLSKADIAIFAKGWENARGCRIERECCEYYGVRIIDVE